MARLMRLFRFELRVGLRSAAGALTGVIFFLTLVTILPFAVGPDLALLGKIGPAILWIGVLLSILIGLDRLFQNDSEDGRLDLLKMSDEPLELIVLTKCLAHWVSNGLPLVFAAPVFGLFLNMQTEEILATSLTLLVGTPALTFLGAIGASLTVAIRKGGLLLPILILPFAIPVLIFGVSASYAISDPLAAFRTPFLFLSATTLFTLVIAPFAAAWALRLQDD